jgi:hypothetical protein
MPSKVLTVYLFGSIRTSRAVHASSCQTYSQHTIPCTAPIRWGTLCIDCVLNKVQAYSFFDTVPIARIISRCATGMCAIDGQLGRLVQSLLGITILLTTTLVAAIYIAE